MTTSTLRITSIALVAFLFAACGGGEEPAAPAPEATTTAPTPAPEPEPTVSYAGPAFEITMTPVGNEMLYEQTEFTVAPGQTVHITFNNTADNPAMQHNVVVLRMGTDVNAFGQAAMGAASTDYIPVPMQGDIVAHTAMSAPGETHEVMFTAPATPGDYTYVCTFPAHYMTMQGTMRVVG